MGQTRQDDTRIELSRPGEPGLTTRMVEKGIQQQPTTSKWQREQIARPTKREDAKTNLSQSQN